MNCIIRNWVVNACDPKAGVVDGAVAPNENAGFGCACWPSAAWVPLAKDYIDADIKGVTYMIVQIVLVALQMQALHLHLPAVMRQRRRLALERWL